MAQQSLVWTALPNGYSADGRLRLSVLLSPRLYPDLDSQRLGSFGEWIDWPTTLRQAQFAVSCNDKTVTVAGDGTGSPNVLDDRLGVADSAAWAALFTRTLFVRPYEFDDFSGRAVISFDASAVSELVQSLYTDLAARADDNMPLISSFSESDLWKAFIDALRAPIIKVHILHLGATPTSVESQQSLLEDFRAFHAPLSTALQPTPRKRLDDERIEATWQEYNRPEMPQPEDLGRPLDFHQIVSAMGSYPKLMRLLGLVVDLLLEPKSFPPSMDSSLSVAVTFPSGVLSTPLTSIGAPVTRTFLNETRFEAVSDPAALSLPLTVYPVKDRLLDLDPARFSVLQADVDGAGLKVMNFGRTLLRRQDANTYVDPATRQEDTAGAPSLRTAGLMVVQRQRGAWLTDRIKANATGNDKLQQQKTLDLCAEDLVRGYRIDIWDATAESWASLCRRTADYKLGEGPFAFGVSCEEESTIRLAATTAADSTTNNSNVSLHEALFTWSGWSLAAPPPGRNICRDAKGPDDVVDKRQDQSEADVPPGIHFTSRFKPVKGSLPRLRFGRSYWMRARAVDLAGNSLDFQSENFKGEDPAAKAVRFLRFEPVAAPVLALTSQRGNVEAPGPGESIARMAIRSYNDTAADNETPSAEYAHRAAVPPRVSVREAEQHGMLDKDGKVDASTFAMLAHDRDLDGHDPLAVVREVVLETQGPLDSSPVETTFAAHEIGRRMTYLPDPLASEVAIRIFSHPNIDPATIISIPLYRGGAWPDARAFIVELYEDPSAVPSFDADSRSLRVPLQKAGHALIRMSMKLNDQALATMGVFAWLDDEGKKAQRQRSVDGQHWMLTPWHELEVVHAVQRPLKTPDINGVSILPRTLGDTNAQPMILAQCSVASTDRLDLRSTSHEPVDDGTGPGDQQRNDVAFSVKVTDPTTYATVLDGNSDGGFPDHTIAGTDLVKINAPDAVTVGRLTAKAHEFHDTRYRRITYWFDATSRFREFLPTSLLTQQTPSGPVPTDRNLTVTGATAVTWIRSSAPPPAPQILYVLPTFTWSRDEDSIGDSVSERRGGLRVYLGRPWNVSGYGEMLGVVLPPARFSGDPDTTPVGHPLNNYVTQWGADPVWDSDVVSGIAPRGAEFSLARTSPASEGAWLPPGAPQSEADQLPGAFKVTGLPLPGLPVTDVTITVAPHDVSWSDERQLWFCDIGLDPGTAYYPFIRLALARYQPISIDGAHLSNVILADFVALTPTRWLAVATTGDPRSREVTVSGHTYRASSGSHEAAGKPGSAAVAKTSIVEVWVEQLDPRLGEDFGWQRVESATATPGPVLAPGADPSEVLWSGQVTVPEGTTSTGPCRLVVAEYEEYMVDDDTPYEPPSTRKGRRLVFVEHYRLDL